MAFPVHRYRRLRLSESLRTMVRETSLAPSDFIAPIFVVPTGWKIVVAMSPAATARSASDWICGPGKNSSGS